MSTGILLLALCLLSLGSTDRFLQVEIHCSASIVFIGQNKCLHKVKYKVHRGIQMRLTTGPTSNMNTTFIVINKPLTDKHWGELGTKKSRKRYSKYQRSCRPVASDDGPGMLAKKMTCYCVTIKKVKKKREKSSESPGIPTFACDNQCSGVANMT